MEKPLVNNSSEEIKEAHLNGPNEPPKRRRYRRKSPDELQLRRDLKAVQKDGLYLRKINNQAAEVCQAAVMQNGEALQYVKDQTYDLCIDMVKFNTDLLRFIKDPMLRKRIIQKLILLQSVKIRQF